MSEKQYYYQSLSVSGSANTTVYGPAVYASEAQPKYIEGIWIAVSARVGSMFLVNLEREILGQINVDLLPIYSDNPKLFIPIRLKLPIGQALQFGLQCSSSACNAIIVVQYTAS